MSFILQKKVNIYIALFLIALSILSLFSKASYLLAFLFAFFIPGYVIVGAFFRELKPAEKLLLYVLLSVLVSTHAVYWSSMVFGYSKETIILVSSLFIPVFLFLPDFSVKNSAKSFGEIDKAGIIFSIIVFLITFFTLFHSVWVPTENYIILTGSNWHDTPMHYGIIESINQGNFPPEMPYYSGLQMKYHYFVDFHTAIIEKVMEGFHPRLLVVINSIFAFIFAYSLYLIAFYITNNKKAAIYAGIIGVFGAGFSYFLFFHDFAAYNGFSHPLETFLSLLRNSYALEWGKFFLIPPLFDFSLSYRPHMMGLPCLIASIYFLYKGFSESKSKQILIAGIIAGLVFPFHLLSYFSCIFLSFFVFLLFLRKMSRLDMFKKIGVFLVPSLISLPFIITTLFFVSSLDSTFTLNPGWCVNDKSLFGLAKFYIGNLGIPFILSISYLFYSIRKKSFKHLFILYAWIFSMLLIPNLISFTPWAWDMGKFFTYLWIPVAITAGALLLEFRGYLRFLVPFLLIFSVLASFFVVTSNVTTEYGWDSWEEYDAGMWIRENTPQKSVFLTQTTIRSPVTQVGGRLRIMGYGTWPHGHGFDMFERAGDIEKKAYPGTIEDAIKVMEKYNASYVYIGKEELGKVPRCNEKFDESDKFEKVYDKKGIKIYLKSPSSH